MGANRPMSYKPTQSRASAVRDLTISLIWIGLCLFFLNFDRHRIVDLRAAGKTVNLVSWVQIPVWVGLIVFWIRNGLRCWARIRANESGSR